MLLGLRMPGQALHAQVICRKGDAQWFRENLRLERQALHERASEVIRTSMELISDANALIARAESPLISAR